MRVQKPARYSSMELSTTSHTRWCSAVPSCTSPRYMPGSLRTASRPSSFVIADSSYCADWFLALSDAPFVSSVITTMFPRNF